MGDKKNWVRVSALRAACASAYDSVTYADMPFDVEGVDAQQTSRILDRAAVFAEWLARESTDDDPADDPDGFEGSSYYAEPGERVLVYGDFSGEIGMRVHTCSNDRCSWGVTDYTDAANEAFRGHTCGHTG
jgi:hypothetical protein